MPLENEFQGLYSLRKKRFGGSNPNDRIPYQNVSPPDSRAIQNTPPPDVSPLVDDIPEAKPNNLQNMASLKGQPTGGDQLTDFGMGAVDTTGMAKATPKVTVGKSFDSDKFARIAGALGAAIAPRDSWQSRLGATASGLATDNLRSKAEAPERALGMELKRAQIDKLKREDKEKRYFSIGSGGLYDTQTGKIISPIENLKDKKPTVRDFQIEGRNVPHQWDETNKKWTPLEGMGGPKWNPKEKALVDVNIGDKSMTELGKEQAKILMEERKDVEGSLTSLRNIQEAKSLLDSGVITGVGAKFITDAGNLLSTRLGFKAFDDPVKNTEAYASIIGIQVGQIIKQFGSGTGLSDADREYAERIVAGDVTLTEKSLRRIIEINERGHANIIKNFNKKAEQVMKKPESKELLYNLMVDMPQIKTSQNIGKAPSQAIEMLKNNPQLADQFKAKYGYLPEGF